MSDENRIVKWSPEALATISDEQLLSEAQRRRARKRKSYTGGLFWAKHNPNVANCRCEVCMRRRQDGEEIEA